MGRPALLGNAICGMCHAKKREAQLPDLEHDLEHHAKMLDLRHHRSSLCAATRLSQHSLSKLGVKLSVDRINNDIGYVKGNCQLLAEPLNQAKGCGRYIPREAVARLKARAKRLVRSVHDRN